MGHDDSPFGISLERELYRTDEIRRSLEKLHYLYDNLSAGNYGNLTDDTKVKSASGKIIDSVSGQAQPHEKLESLDYAIAYTYGFFDGAFYMLKKYDSVDDSEIKKGLEKLNDSRDFEKGSEDGGEYADAVLSWGASDQTKKEHCWWFKKLIIGLLAELTKTNDDGSRL